MIWISYFTTVGAPQSMTGILARNGSRFSNSDILKGTSDSVSMDSRRTELEILEARRNLVGV